MSEPPVLAFPNEGAQFSVHTNAPQCALGALMMQSGNHEKFGVVQCASRGLAKTERTYSTFEEDVPAVIFALKKFLHHLWGGPFILYGDHNALRATFWEGWYPRAICLVTWHNGRVFFWDSLFL